MDSSGLTICSRTGVGEKMAGFGGLTVSDGRGTSSCQPAKWFTGILEQQPREKMIATFDETFDDDVLAQETE